jgi:hypothetical protein
MRQMVVTPDTDWFSDQSHYFFLYSQSCEIHRLVPNKCTSIYFSLYELYLSKMVEIVTCCVYICVQYNMATMLFGLLFEQLLRLFSAFFICHTCQVDMLSWQRTHAH